MSDKNSRIVILFNLFMALTILTISFVYKNFFDNDFKYDSTLLYYYIAIYIIIHLYYKFIRKLNSSIAFWYLLVFTLLNFSVVIYNALKIWQIIFQDKTT